MHRFGSSKHAQSLCIFRMPRFDLDSRAMDANEKPPLDSASGSAARSPVGTVGVDQVTTWLIVISILIYVLDQSLRLHGQDAFGRPLVVPRALTFWGFFSNGSAIAGGQVWRFLTFQFLHQNILHLGMNMLGLYFFGPLIETLFGSRRFIVFYLLCGIAGALAFSILSLFGLVSTGGWLIGASAGVFGVLIASAQVAPEETVLVFGIIPMKLRPLAWLLIAIALYTIFTHGKNAGGEAAHLGGALMGWLLIRNPAWLSVFGEPPPSRGSDT